MRTAVGTLLVAFAVVVLHADQSSLGTPPDPEGFALWKSDRVNDTADRLGRTIGTNPMVFETIGNYDGHSIYLVLRGATGNAELHETEADLFVARRGRATLVIGGELLGAETLPRRQRRGSGIKGGGRHVLMPGDIVHIPVGVAHQLLVEPGDRFMYELVKFDEEPLSTPRAR